MSILLFPAAVRRSVLVVDDSSLLRGILKAELEAEGFDVHLAEDGARALELARDLRPDMILLDIRLPGIDGHEVCRRIKTDDATNGIPVLMVTASNELKDKLAGFEAGADDYLTKPFFTKELLARVRRNLRSRESIPAHSAVVVANARLEREVRSMFLGIIVSMASAVDAKDAYTHGHSLRVARMSLLVAQEIGLPNEELEPLLLSAILHDVGKIAIPDNILNKPGLLDEEELRIMSGHPVAGAKMLQNIPALDTVTPGILHHHEYWNGSGYPYGLGAEAIPLQGRIIHVGDAFDAMTTDRVYRKKVGVAGALTEIEKLSGRQFDPSLVSSLLAARRRGSIHDELPDSTPTLHELMEQIQ